MNLDSEKAITPVTGILTPTKMSYPPFITTRYFKGNPDKLNKLLQEVGWEDIRVTLLTLNSAT